MKGGQPDAGDHVLQLLADRATEGLDDERMMQLSGYMTTDEGHDADGLDRAAAVVGLAFLPSRARVPLPSSLKSRLVTDAVGHFGLEPEAPVSSAWRPPPVATAPPRGGGWYAAAAALVVAVVGWWPATPSPSTPSPADEYAEFAASSGDVIQATWAGQVAEFRTVSGDVTWSNARQHGFMRFIGLPANDPSKQQYQLWIVDPDRDEHPIDGGVFDAPEGPTELIVPIDAKLAARNPTAFAITREKPGGVVVSAGPLLIVAAVPG